MRLLLGTLLLVLLAGCSSDDEVSTSSRNGGPTVTSSPSAAAADNPSCTALDDAALRALAGGDVSEPRTVTVAEVPACQWDAPDGLQLQVIAASADAWARGLPSAIDQLRANPALRQTDVAKLDQALDLVTGDALTPAQGCALFRTLLEIQGEEKGSTSTVALFPDRTRPIAVTGQRCVDGRYVSVQFARTSGVLDKPLPVQRVRTALAAALTS